MKSLSLILLSLFVCIQSAISQVTPNSNRFEVKNYVAIDNSGKYHPYYSHGFVENVANGSNARIFIMPIIELDIDNIKYIGSDGLETYSSADDVYSISIPITAEQSLPNESQKAAIGASLDAGTTLPFYLPAIVKNNFGGPLIHPNAGVYTSQIVAQTNQYEQNLKKQQKFIEVYNKYIPEITSLIEYEVVAEVGNDVVYNERFPGTYISMGNSLDEISIDRPSSYVKNRIAQGNFNIVIKYKFKDSENSYINANINASVIINQFLSEAQQSTVSQKSSGWSFLGFGSRSKSIKSSFDQQVNQQYTDQRFSNTTIEMYDADDSMIKMFESAFFPTLTKQKAIENHIAAAEKAQLSGNGQLQQMHLDYVKALQTNDPDLEVNIGEAAAALAKEDYVGFIAHGVRWGDYQANGNSEFRRVLNSNEMTQMEAQWSQTKTITVQHAISQKVSISEDVELRAHLGLINGIPYQGNLVISNGLFNKLESISGIIIGPISVGGALHQNNIISGTLLIRIGQQSVNDGQSLRNVLSNYDPGDNVRLTIIEQIGQSVFKKKNISIELGAYPK